MGQINTPIHLIEKKEDLDNLAIKRDQKIAYVTQTTLSVDDTQSIIEAIKNKFSNVVGPRKNDICYATSNRQNAIKKIASYCDLFIVIGSHNSSNSLRLVEVAKQYGAKESLLIENIEIFNLSKINKVSNIGLTASASAPEILVQNFIQIMQNKFKIKLHESNFAPESVNFKIPHQLKTEI